MTYLHNRLACPISYIRRGDYIILILINYNSLLLRLSEPSALRFDIEFVNDLHSDAKGQKLFISVEDFSKILQNIH